MGSSEARKPMSLTMGAVLKFQQSQEGVTFIRKHQNPTRPYLFFKAAQVISASFSCATSGSPIQLIFIALFGHIARHSPQPKQTSLSIFISPSTTEMASVGQFSRHPSHRSHFSLSTEGLTMLSVSYTHLRAHETRHDLVCRLL